MDIEFPEETLSVHDFLHEHLSRSGKIEEDLHQPDELDTFLTASMTFLQNQLLEKFKHDDRNRITTRLHLGKNGSYILLKNSDTYTNHIYGEMNTSVSSLTLEQILPTPRKSRMFEKLFKKKTDISRNKSIFKGFFRTTNSSNSKETFKKVKIASPRSKFTYVDNTMDTPVKTKLLPILVDSESFMSVDLESCQLDKNMENLTEKNVSSFKVRRLSSKMSMCDDNIEEEEEID